MKLKSILTWSCLWPLAVAANTPEPTSALAYQQMTNTRIVVGENSLRFYTGGSERMTMDGEGFVGIGTSEPEASLDVNGSAIIRGSINVHGTDLKLGLGESRDIGDNPFQRALVHFHEDRLYLNYDGDFEGGVRVQGEKTIIEGNVGIGMTDPGNYKLNVDGSLMANSYLDIGKSRPDNSRVRGLFFGESGNVHSSIQLAVQGWSGSHGILFNAYQSESLVDGSIVQTGNTKYTHNQCGYGGGAGSFVYSSHGGVMSFYISPVSTGAGNDINWGTSKMQIRRNGTIGINTNSPDETYMLHVNGKTYATSFHTSANTYADFVFEDSYRLAPLSEVEQYIEQNHHLPDIPSESEAKANGIDLQEMQSKLLQKIEELTLYVIEQNKKLENQNERIESLESQLKTTKQ